MSVTNPKLSLSLMVQGTTSDAGKSAICAGICRVLKRQNISVAPFKPQNMALNSAVTIIMAKLVVLKSTGTSMWA